MGQILDKDVQCFLCLVASTLNSEKNELILHFLEKIKTEVVSQKCSVKQMFLEILQNSLENTCARVSFLIKLQACNFTKNETLAQVFPCEFCENSKNNFSYRAPPVAASVKTTHNKQQN